MPPEIENDAGLPTIASISISSFGESATTYTSKGFDICSLIENRRTDSVLSPDAKLSSSMAIERLSAEDYDFSFNVVVTMSRMRLFCIHARALSFRTGPRTPAMTHAFLCMSTRHRSSPG
jgi:hypothetical protein